jgi:hypothetical protein
VHTKVNNNNGRTIRAIITQPAWFAANSDTRVIDTPARREQPPTGRGSRFSPGRFIAIYGQRWRLASVLFIGDCLLYSMSSCCCATPTVIDPA